MRNIVITAVINFFNYYYLIDNYLMRNDLNLKNLFNY